MFNRELVEKDLRELLKEQWMIDQIDFMDLSDDLVLDSLAQTELRVYIDEHYGINTSIEHMPISTTQSLGQLIDFIITNSVKAA